MKKTHTKPKNKVVVCTLPECESRGRILDCCSKGQIRDLKNSSRFFSFVMFEDIVAISPKFIDLFCHVT